jgi:hypothetical protein
VSQPVLYVIACAAPPAREVTRLIDAAQGEGWDTCLLAAPSAVKFLDVPALAKQTGHPVRSDYKDPDDPDSLPVRTLWSLRQASILTPSSGTWPWNPYGRSSAPALAHSELLSIR